MSLFHSPRWFRQFLYPVKDLMPSIGHLNTKHCQHERMDLLFLWSGLWLSLFQLSLSFLSTYGHIKRLCCLGCHSPWVFCSSFVLVTSVYGEKFEREIKLYYSKTEQHPKTNAWQKPCCFFSAISVLSWLPLVIVNYLTFFRRVDIPNVFVDIINILNFSNSILNPFIYALRIPQFRQTLVLCSSRRQAVMNRQGKEEKANIAAFLKPALQPRSSHPESSQVEQTSDRQKVMDTKLWSNCLFYIYSTDIYIL